jgi:Domain of unknown function (DUF1707).
VPGARPLVSDADRERLVALLREHYAVGLFGLDELDRRVGVVLSVRYLDEAAAAVSDLPGIAGTGTAAPPGNAAPRRARRRRGHAHADQPAAGWVPTERAVPRPQHEHRHASLGRSRRPEPPLRPGARTVTGTG